MALNVLLEEYVGKRVRVNLCFGESQIVREGVLSLIAPSSFVLHGEPQPLSYTRVTESSGTPGSVPTKDGRNFGYRVDGKVIGDMWPRIELLAQTKRITHIQEIN